MQATLTLILFEYDPVGTNSQAPLAGSTLQRPDVAIASHSEKLDSIQNSSAIFGR